MAQCTTNQDSMKQRCAEKSAITPVLVGTLARMRGMDMRDGEQNSKGQAIGILLLIVNQEVAAEKIAGTGLL